MLIVLGGERKLKSAGSEWVRKNTSWMMSECKSAAGWDGRRLELRRALILPVGVCGVKGRDVFNAGSQGTGAATLARRLTQLGRGGKRQVDGPVKAPGKSHFGRDALCHSA